MTLEWKLDPNASNGRAILILARTVPSSNQKGGEDNSIVGDAESYDLDLDDGGTYYWHVQSFTCPPSENPYECFDATKKWGPTFAFTNVVPPVAKTEPVRRKPLTRAQLAKRRAEQRAARAVKREIAWDDGDDIAVGAPSVHCRARSGGYSCTVGFVDAHDHSDYVEGRARVTQYGSHYSVSYRIYW